ncbi:RNA polymerase sigma factor [Aquimarina agarilytica]|uniref:RNA polymerase sigma factor n=1 Tax=Aquimarina agarilytica TaxID=1087449 RepID=UPI00028930B1|nr:sigma-70 family RNA polymerase sigma factor [Aquimarina agarilytica]
MDNLQSVCSEKNYELLYDKYSNSLYSFMYFRCGNADQAADLVQEAYIKLWKNCAKVFFEKAKSYLYTVASNHFLNEVAHEKVKLTYQVTEYHLDRNYENPEYVLEEKEYMSTLETAIANLTTAQREVFLLNRIEGKKYKEISEMLNISVKAVEKRMHLALIKLRETLGDKI